MKSKTAIALGAALACAFAAPAFTQDAEVDQAELKRIMAEHPAWAVWLADPALAKLALAGPKMPNSNWRVADIRRPQPPKVETGKACAAPPPGDAEVLFDGRDLSRLTGDKMDQWTVQNGELVAGGKVYNFIRHSDHGTLGQDLKHTHDR